MGLFGDSRPNFPARRSRRSPRTVRPRDRTPGEDLQALSYEILSVRALHEARLKSEVLNGTVHVDTSDWFVDQTKGEIRFTNQEAGTLAIAPVQIIGTHLPERRSWQWSWANPSIQAELTRSAKLVRAYGERHGIAHLTNPKLSCDSDAAWELGAIACLLAGDQGVYRGEAEGTRILVTFGSVRLTRLPE